jgi:hypothetical protein
MSPNVTQESAEVRTFKSCAAPQVVILNERCNLNTSSSLRPKAEIMSKAEGKDPNRRSPPYALAGSLIADRLIA